MNTLTTLSSVLPACSKAAERLESLGCVTLGDLQQLITRFALTLRPGDNLRIDWLAMPVEQMRLNASTWLTLLWALEQTGFRWSDHLVDPTRSRQERT